MCVQGGGAGGFILRFRQQAFQLRVFLSPGFLAWVKGVGDAAPADVPGKGLLLRCRGAPALGLNLFQGADGRHVGGVLHLWPSYAQVIVGDMEICVGGQFILRGEQVGVALIVSQTVLEGLPVYHPVAPRIRPRVHAHVLFTHIAHRAGQLLVAVWQGHMVAHVVEGNALQHVFSAVETVGILLGLFFVLEGLAHFIHQIIVVRLPVPNDERFLKGVGSLLDGIAIHRLFKAVDLLLIQGAEHTRHIVPGGRPFGVEFIVDD